MLSRRNFLRFLLASGLVSQFPTLADQSADSFPIFVDAHIDLGYNMLNFGRDYTMSAFDIREAEAESDSRWVSGEATLGLPELLAGRVALMFEV